MSDLYPHQVSAIQYLSRPGHLIVISPTGSGKSRIFLEILKRNSRRMLLVVPLRALARQHFKSLKSAGLNVALNGKMPHRSSPSAPPDVWIVSPEKIEHDVEAIKRWNPDFLVVDEAHCIYEWGRDFRPAFASLPQWSAWSSVRRSLWLTATMELDHQKLLLESLPEERRSLQGDVKWPSAIHLNVRRVPLLSRWQALRDFVGKARGPGLVFAVTRSECSRLGRLLRSLGIRVVVYHAGFSEEERLTLDRMIFRGDFDVIVATSAFGMGMDLGFLNWVILHGPPLTLSQMMQMVGRVGRRSVQAKAEVFWDVEDFECLEWVLSQSDRSKKACTDVFRFLTSNRCGSTLLEEYFRQGSKALFVTENGPSLTPEVM